MSWKNSRRGALVAVGVFVAVLASAALAQNSPFGGQPLRGLDGGPAGLEAEGDRVAASGKILLRADGHSGVLRVTATIEPGWHIYSITQKAGGPIQTKLKLKPSADYSVGEFKALTPPIESISDAFGGLIVEEHSDQAVWEAPIKISAGVDPNKLVVAGAVYAQACSDSCLAPTDYSFTARVAVGEVLGDAVPTAEVAEGDDEYRGEAHATWRGQVEFPNKPGEPFARLLIEADPDRDPQYHIYAFADRDDNALGPKPTLIVLKDTSGLRTKRPIVEGDLVEGKSPEDGNKKYYTSPVLWSTDLVLPEKANGDEYTVTGFIGYMTCRKGQCDLPQGARFSVVIPAKPAAKAIPVTFVSAKYGEAAQLAMKATTGSLGAGSPGGPSTPGATPAFTTLELLEVIGYSLLGGMILNLMPCVLPVLGLKLMSFVEQGGQSRSRVLTLNLWYTLGILLVFWVLAGLAVWMNLSWGAQFQEPSFNIIVASIVWVMALSFLGVWEIPIPGFVGSSKASKVAAREGVVGAMAKGALTTVLATPCSGPFLGAVFGFTIDKPPVIIFAIFTAIGVGMATPYLLIGAFPSLIRFLPKPGMWMETFKQVMGFFLVATVVYLFAILKPDYHTSTFALLMGLWFACWYLGRTPLYSDTGKLLKAWAGAVVIAGVIGFCAFQYLYALRITIPDEARTIPAVESMEFFRFAEEKFPEITKKQVDEFRVNWKEQGRETSPAEIVAALDAFAERQKLVPALPWRSFTPDKLRKLVEDGNTVMVDFTASWCPNCLVNTKIAIETLAVREMVQENGVATLLADWTDYSDEIKKVLKSHGSKTIPLLVIYPANQPDKPIILRDLITKSQLLAALKDAGASHIAAKKRSTSVAGGQSSGQ